MGAGSVVRLAFDVDVMIDATTEIEVGLDSRGRSAVTRMRCEVPMLVRVIDQVGPMLSLAMVNGAAGPLGGDRLRFRLELGPDTKVALCSVAATMAQPGARGEASELLVDVVVGDRAMLNWHPQPTVSVMGSDHRVVVRVWAKSSSTVSLREGVSLGRRDEPPGRFALRERVTIDDVAVLDHETMFAPGALLGPGAQGARRMMTTEVVVGAVLPAPCVEVTDHRLRSAVHLSPLCALVTTLI
jgi:urease accessory protein